MTEESVVPGLETDLTEGHSRDCLRLEIEYYNDLFREIETTLNSVRNNLIEWILEADEDFAEKVDDFLCTIDLNGKSFGGLLANVCDIQRFVIESNLDEEEKHRLWQPIAECYSKVQSVLKERIKPLEERTVIHEGDTIVVPVIVRNYRILAKSDPFKYVSQRLNAVDKSYFEAVSIFMLQESYLRGLSSKIRERLAWEKISYLPLKIVSMERGMHVIAQIDEETFMQHDDWSYEQQI